jgi:phytoene synthase
VTHPSDTGAGPREGSSAAYAVLFAPPAQRARINALFTFRREIDDTLFTAGDPGVARIKRAWWAEELGRLGEGSPRHPATAALDPASPELVECLRRYLGAVDSWLEQGQESDGYRAFCMATGGCLAEALCHLATPSADPETPDGRSAVRSLGAAIRSTALLRLGRVAPALRALLLGPDAAEEQERSIIDWTAQTFARGLANMPAAGRGQYRAVLVMAELYRRLLDKVDGSEPGTYVELRAPAKLWIAWSAARRAGRVKPARKRDDSYAS